MNPMTYDDYVAVAQQWISLWCPTPDWALFERLHADDFVDCSPAGRGATKADYRAALQEFTVAFPDARIQLDQAIVDTQQGSVAVRWSGTATDATGATGKAHAGMRVHMQGIEIIDIVERRIIRRWGEWNLEHLRPVTSLHR